MSPGMGGVGELVHERIVWAAALVVRDRAVVAAVAGSDARPVDAVANGQGLRGMVCLDRFMHCVDGPYAFVAQQRWSWQGELTLPEVRISPANASELHLNRDMAFLGR